MRALTVRQPFAGLIALGHKRIENRGWRPSLAPGERFAIHAGKRWDANAEKRSPAGPRVPDEFRGYLIRESATLGAIIATASVSGIVESAHAAELAVPGQGQWFIGPLGWVLEDVRPLVKPIPALGALNLWRLPADVEAMLPEGVQ